MGRENNQVQLSGVIHLNKIHEKVTKLSSLLCVHLQLVNSFGSWEQAHVEPGVVGMTAD